MEPPLVIDTRPLIREVAEDARRGVSPETVGGISERVCLEHLPKAQPGDYVLVHVGFALQLIDGEEAGRIFAFLEQANQFDELEEPPP